MKKIEVMLATLLFIFSFTVSKSSAAVSARILRFPAVSKKYIAFVYADNIWIAPKHGGTAMELTTESKGEESFPKFSPNGKTIAFTGNYNGEDNLYVIPTSGGIPKQITHDPFIDRMITWYPNGKRILFASFLGAAPVYGSNPETNLWSVSPQGGLPKKFPIPSNGFVSFSPHGKWIAYTTKSPFWIPSDTPQFNWAGYKGGYAGQIWLFNTKTYQSHKITKGPWDNNFPMWHHSSIYYVSDKGQGHRYNLWRYSLATRRSYQITHFRKFGIQYPSLGPENIVFEAGGKLYLYSLKTKQYHSVRINVVTDEKALIPHLVNAGKLVRHAAISPNGERVVFQAEGNLFSVPEKHGVVFDLTQSNGSFAARFPSWSPNGEYVAYWGDQTGNYELYLQKANGIGNPKKLTSFGAGYRFHLYWSPNSRKIAFVGSRGIVRIYDLKTKKMIEVSEHYWVDYPSLKNFQVSWSPDSRWIAYSKAVKNMNDAIFLFDTKKKRNYQVTSGYYNDWDPVFDLSGKYLFFLTQDTFSPVGSEVSSFSPSFVFMNGTRIAADPLTSKVVSFLAPRNDVQKAVLSKSSLKRSSLHKHSSKKAPLKSQKIKKTKGTLKKKAQSGTKIQISGFEKRMFLLPVPAGNYIHLQAAPGKVLYFQIPGQPSPQSQGSLFYFDLMARKSEPIIGGIGGYHLSADHQKLLVWSSGSYSIIPLAPQQTLTTFLNLKDLKMQIVPMKQWEQIFRDAWTFEKAFYYAPDMSHIHWNKVYQKYAPLVKDCVTRNDLNWLLGQMISELSSSHLFVFGGVLKYPEQQNVGLLGIDWKLNHGAYQIAKIIHGAPWNSSIRSPLSGPGVKVKQGDYILAVNGVRLNPHQDPWKPFVGLEGETVQLTVNNHPTFKKSWKILVKTLSFIQVLRLSDQAWIEKNQKIVSRLSGGKIGYIYVPDTFTVGMSELARQFYAQWNKKALIIDERFNAGGFIPNHFIELLNRPLFGFMTTRGKGNLQTPLAANFGPKVMLTNGWSGSGGDLFPYLFKQEKVGLVIGTRTWGGLIGMEGNPVFVDGGMVSVPTFRWYNPKGEWFPENEGTLPNIKIENTPTSLAEGKDLQLETAVKVLLKELKEHPVNLPERPPYSNFSL
jgi:tricorn protease